MRHFFQLIQSDKSKLAVLLLGLLFISTLSFFIRTYNISDTFWAYGDQLRDWKIALSGNLPLHGTPKVGGGYSLGPIFYWVLHVIAITLGPLFNNLPHAGGYGLAFLRALADSFLFYALIKNKINPFATTGLFLLILTQPLESSLSGVIWNPGLAITFMVCSTAAILLYIPSKKFHWLALSIVCIQLGVHCHTPVVFWGLANLATCTYFIISFFFHEQTSKRQIISLCKWALLAFAVCCLLQIPYLLHSIQDSSSDRNVDRAIRGMLSLNPDFVFFRAVIDQSSAFFDISAKVFIAIISISTLAAFHLFTFCNQKKLQAGLIIIPLLSLCATGFAFAFSRIRIDTYWIMNLVYPLSIAPAILCLPTFKIKGIRYLSFIFAITIFSYSIFMFNDRFDERRQKFQLPAYGQITKTLLKIQSTNEPMREIRMDFGKYKQHDVEQLFQIIKGRLESDSKKMAIIHRDGTVEYRHDQSDAKR